MSTTFVAPPGTRPGAVDVESFVGAGGRVLRCRVVRSPGPGRALLYLHGIESHGGWFLPAAQGLARHGCTTWLLDRRGSGLNRDEDEGDAASAEVLLEDVRRFRAHARLEQVVTVGLSWGGKLAVASALDQPEGVRALVLVTPGLVPRVDLPLRSKLRLALSLLAGGRARVHLPIEPDMFTRTPSYQEYIAGDPDRITRVTARMLLASHRLDRRIRDGIAGLRPPVLLFLAGHDRIIDNERTLALLQRRTTGRLRVRLYEHATHSIQFDDTADLVRDTSAFLDEVDARGEAAC